MAITFKSSGVVDWAVTSGEDLGPTCPATVDVNDILIAHVWYRDTTTTPDTPNGWTLLSGPHTIVASRAWVYGKIAVGNEDGTGVSFGTQAITVLRGAKVYSYSGYVSGTITDVVQGFIFGEGTTAAIDDVDITTSMDGAAAVNLVAIEDDLPSPSFSPTNTGVSNGPWIESVSEEVSSLGSDGTLGIQHRLLATAGTIGGGSFTRGAADNWGIIGFEIRPNAPAAAAPTPVWPRRRQPYQQGLITTPVRSR